MAVTMFRSRLFKWVVLGTQGGQLYAYTFKTKKNAKKKYETLLECTKCKKGN